MSQHAERVRATLESLVDSGDLVAWTEMDAEVAFDCYRLNPDRYPDAYVRYPKAALNDGPAPEKDADHAEG